MDAEALMKARWIRDAQRQLLREQEARRQRLIEDCLWRHYWGEVGQRPAPLEEQAAALRALRRR